MEEVCELEDTRGRFRVHSTREQWPIYWKVRVRMTTGTGTEAQTCVYVNKGKEESLLGQEDAEALGIIAKVHGPN